jgi:hypothetical protein
MPRPARSVPVMKTPRTGRAATQCPYGSLWSASSVRLDMTTWAQRARIAGRTSHPVRGADSRCRAPHDSCQLDRVRVHLDDRPDLATCLFMRRSPACCLAERPLDRTVDEMRTRRVLHGHEGPTSVSAKGARSVTPPRRSPPSASDLGTFRKLFGSSLRHSLSRFRRRSRGPYT